MRIGIRRNPEGEPLAATAMISDLFAKEFEGADHREILEAHSIEGLQRVVIRGLHESQQFGISALCILWHGQAYPVRQQTLPPIRRVGKNEIDVYTAGIEMHHPVIVDALGWIRRIPAKGGERVSIQDAEAIGAISLQRGNDVRS